MKTITFINEKGGIGKSSLCFNSAWELSKQKRVLIIDLDGQKANITFFAGVEKIEDMLTMLPVLNGTKDIESTICNIKENLDIVPATYETGNINTSTQLLAYVTNFRKALKSIEKKYDFVFIDVNPNPGNTHVLSLAVSDGIVVPMLTDVACLEANKGIAESIQQIKETINPNLKVYGIVFNQNEDRTKLGRSVKNLTDKISSQLETEVFDVKIRNAVALKENISVHTGITDYSPESGAALDYRRFIKELLKRVGD